MLIASRAGAAPSGVGGAKSDRRVLLVAAAALGLFVAYPASVAATYSPMMEPLAASFGGSRTVPSYGFAAATLGQAIGALLVGGLIRRFGATRILLAAIPGFALLVASLAVTPAKPAPFLLVNFGIGLVSSGAGVGLYLSLLSRWFDRHLGRALGFALLGMSSGMLVLPVGVQIVVGQIGWRLTYLGLALLSLTVGSATGWILIRRAGRVTAASTAGPVCGVHANRACRGSRFWMMASACFLGSMAGFGMSIYAIPLYRDAGLTGTQLAQVAAALGAGSILGRFGLGVCADFVHAPYAVAAVFGLAGLGGVYLGLSGGSIWAIFFIGLALGTESDAMAFLVRRYFGALDHATIYNRLLAINYLGGMAGPPLMAASLTTFKSYQPALFTGAACYALAAALIAVLGPYPFPASSVGATGDLP